MRQLQKILLARNAMATRWEIALYGEEPRQLRAAGEEALDEIERIESRISPFKAGSEIFLLNKTAFKQPVKVSPEVFELIKTTRDIWELTEGAFDITIGRLMNMWGFRNGNSLYPAEDKINAIRMHCGMNNVELDKESRTIRFLNSAIQLDFGAIGKGYAIDQAIAILRESGVSSAFIHAGTSTAAAFNYPPPPETWKIAIELPEYLCENQPSLIKTVELKDNSISVSAVWGRKSQISEEYGHIIDPHRGKPAEKCFMAAVLHKSATFSDALSTALLVGGIELAEKIMRKIGVSDLLVVQKQQNSNKLTIHKYGLFADPV